ncbi:MAG: polysaccharide pyruvyl transferase family protein [Sphingomonas adhaesiva]|uniref:polysaccharide pyruvyl transferase family protein n=1 Tax=Sphingomonas adhaesiva TaxID=28212 RepID=UPI002FFA4DD9
MQLIHFRNSVPNFGDDLNVDLWPAFVPELFADSSVDRGFCGIGTIIGMNTDVTQLDIFSSGAGYLHVDLWAKKRITVHCVRGPLTAKLMGVGPELALGDGAITVPLAPAFPDRGTGGGGTVVIPHFETIAYPGWAEACAQAGFTLIDPRGTPAEVIGAIARADLVLTESLHGAILADVYGVPWIAFGCSRNLSTSKWVDWLATLSLDFSTTLVPPPNAAQLLRFGKRAEPFGTTLTFTLDEAMREYAGRMNQIEKTGYGPPGGPKAWVKSVVAAVPPLQRLLGYSPARTAEALTALAARPTSLSQEARRDSLRDRMMEKLYALDRSMR